MIGALWNTLHEIRGFARIAEGRRSLVRFGLDAIAYRLLQLTPSRTIGRVRTIRIAGGTVLEYRCNRADVLTIREVWLDEIYRLPFDFAPRTVLDLGANIGLSAVWFARTYGSTVLSVEPLAENVALAKRNVALNRVSVEVVEAAVGASDRTGRFDPGPGANLGRLADAGRSVGVLSPATLLDRLGHVDLVKMDIEGGEAAALADPSWLSGCDSLIVEFHPARVDYEHLVDAIVGCGFEFYRHGSVLPKTADFFIRPHARARPGTAQRSLGKARGEPDAHPRRGRHAGADQARRLPRDLT